MEQIETKLMEKTTDDAHDGSLSDCLFALQKPEEDICFFDIETTGLSPAVSSVYLIGAAFLRNDSLMLRQWFADDYVSEKAILADFADFASAFTVFVHYNGSTFDIPYLEKKYRSHNLPSPFEGRESLDIFREIRRKKEFFNTPDLKLATMEQLLGFRRLDPYTGRDCIRLYTDFMQQKVFRSNSAKLLKKSLLLHNRDDLIGTVLCSRLLYHTGYFGTSPSCQSEQGLLVIRDTIPVSYPVSGQSERDGVFFTFDKNSLTVRIPLYRGTLYHFYKDYKNYYYLPEEDMAVHKSVAVYVDAGRRENATAANCYTKRSGAFLPLPRHMRPEGLPLFQQTRRAGDLYLPLEDPSSLSADFLRELLRELFR